MKKHKILIVDDDVNIRRLIRHKLEYSGYDIECASNGREAFEEIQKDDYDVILTDLMMPEMNGDELIRMVKQYYPDIPAIMLTAFGSVEHAVKSLKDGAADYITKPVQLDELMIKIASIIEKQDLKREVKYLKEELRHSPHASGIVGNSPKIQETFKQISMVAHSDVSVIIQGESGTGKELVARAIHHASSRSASQFIPVNCGALPEELLENELFGHVKGAYTGAHATEKGLFQEAIGGTIFLDEVTEMSTATQVKLLRVLQEGEIKPVGSPKAIKVDVRILAATNKNVSQEVDHKRFREDLYYRLNVVTIHVPPLRERKVDIPLLANHFLKKYSTQFNKDVIGITPQAMEKMISHDWTGNVRELENKIQQAILMTKTNQIMPEDLSIWIEPDVKPMRPFNDAKQEVIENFEKNYIIKALRIFNGNVTKASEKAGKDRKSFWRIMKKYDIDADDYRS